MTGGSSAISHPRVTMLGHATGRLLLRRDGYHVDLEAVLQAAAKHGTLIEINASPYRLDLDWIHCKRARRSACSSSSTPMPMHRTRSPSRPSASMSARRGWLRKQDVFNTKTLAQVAAKELEKRKK